MKLLITIALVWLAIATVCGLIIGRVIRCNRLEITYSPVPLRKKPRPGAALIRKIPQNTVVEVTAQKGFWVKVEYVDGWGKYHKGWATSMAMRPKLDI